MSKIDEDGIVRRVDTELKKGGTFDKIRKQTTEQIRESKTVQRIEKDMLEKVDEIMKSSSNLSREEIQRKVREIMNNDPKTRNDINRQTRAELDKDWVHDTLNAEIQEKVTKQLEEYS